MKKKLTRKAFVETNSIVLKKMRRGDPIQFDVLYHEWVRANNNGEL